jgi:hypothetical protein
MAVDEDVLQAGTTKSFRTAMYVLRFTPEEKAMLEQKVRVAAALGKTPLTLAEALRMGAAALLDDMIDDLRKKLDSGGEGDGVPIG